MALKGAAPGHVRPQQQLQQHPHQALATQTMIRGLGPTSHVRGVADEGVKKWDLDCHKHMARGQCLFFGNYTGGKNPIYPCRTTAEDYTHG